MKVHRLPAITLLALAAMLVAPLAAADTGQVTAEAAIYAGGAKLRGQASAFYLVDFAIPPGYTPVVDPEPGADTQPVLGIEVKAEQLEAMVFERNQVVSAQDLVVQADPRHPSEPPERHVLEKVSGALTTHQKKFQVTVLPASADATVPFDARLQAGRADPQDSLHTAQGTFGPAQEGDIDDRDPASARFWSVRVDAPMVVHTDQGAQSDVIFTGDLVLELQGASLQVAGKEGELALETGVWRDSGLGSGVPLDQPAAAAQRTVFARILLIDATLRITVQGGSPAVFLASNATASEHAGDVTLLGAVGSVSTEDQARELDQERYVVPAGHTLALGRQPERLDVQLAPTAVVPAPAGPGSFAASTSSVLVAAAAILALAIAAGLGLARRLTHTPDLAQVEAAIEAQRFGRAARLAKRILRAKPASEDAMLGRAIALSKGGHAGRAIAEIRAHLAQREATDGSLHYVLGLAFLDLGREDDARAALGEAVRRTPALQADVVSRLGQQTSSPPTPTPLREAHGYA